MLMARWVAAIGDVSCDLMTSMVDVSQEVLRLPDVWQTVW